MPPEYFIEIESHFAARRGTVFILNAKDWALMKNWSDNGIPLSVVIEAIDSVFDKNLEKGSRKVINSLSYCRHAVKELWEERRELQVGTEGGTPEEGVGLLLAALAAELQSSEEPVIASFAPRVREVASLGSVPRIEERLIELESELLDAVLESAADAAAIRDQAGAIAVGGTDEKTRARTIDANLRRIVREKYSLPRLTLFR